MKTKADLIPFSGTAKAGMLQPLGAVGTGIVLALIFHRVSVDGLWGVSGDRLPVALLGTSAWLYFGIALGARDLFRGLAHLSFGAVVFGAAVVGMSGESASLAPWFLAQAGWIFAHREDGKGRAVVLGWAGFNVAIAAALTV